MPYRIEADGIMVLQHLLRGLPHQICRSADDCRPRAGAAAWLAAPRLLTRIAVASVSAAWRTGVRDRSCDPGVFLAYFLEALGPTFIKLGQVLSCRPDLLPDRVLGALRRLQDRVAPIDLRLIPRLVEDSLGMPLHQAFARFDPVPVSSASIALVHKATLRTGETVAVKIRRPGLRQVVETDLAALSSLAACLEYFPVFRHVPLGDTIDEFGDIVRRQLDFEKEAGNNRRFQRNFAKQSDVRIPRLFEGFCTDAAITMEYLEGLKNFNDLEASSETARRVAKLTLGALFQMIFEHGVVHADMHPGNVFLLGADTLALVDTGFVAELDPADRRNFASFFFGMVSNNGRECARILYETATFRAKKCQRKAFEADVAALVSLHFAKTARDFNVTRFSTQLFAVLQRHGLRGSTKFMTTILSLVVFEGVAKQIDPDLDFQAEARRYIPLVLRALFAPADRAAATGRA